MKIRKSFVTNSSSSSFILMSKKDIHNENILFTISVPSYSIIDDTITNKEELLEWFDCHYGAQPEYEYWDEFEDEYNEMLSKIEEGFSFYIGRASNEDDEAISQLLYYHGFDNTELPKHIEIYKDKR